MHFERKALCSPSLPRAREHRCFCCSCSGVAWLSTSISVMAASTSALSVAKIAVVLASLASSRSAVNETPVGVALPSSVVASKCVLVNCRASAVEKDGTSRRSALALLAGLAAVGLQASPVLAASVEPANHFGAPKQQSGFSTYTGEGFSVDIPSKWNPSKEFEFPGQVLRYEDNFDQVSNLSVSILASSVKSIKDFGSPKAFLEQNSYLLGKQAYQGETASEGGFEKNAAVTASIFAAEEKEINGKPYYSLEVLTRTADGTEGGRHQNIVATVANGKLFIFKAQAGDKRWFKGSQKFIEGAAASFRVEHHEH